MLQHDAGHHRPADAGGQPDGASPGVLCSDPEPEARQVLCLGQCPSGKQTDLDVYRERKQFILRGWLLPSQRLAGWRHGRKLRLWLSPSGSWKSPVAGVKATDLKADLTQLS